MSVLSVRLSDSEYSALEKYAKTNSVSVRKALKDSFFKMFEDQYDIKSFYEAYAKFLKKDSKTYTSREIAKELNIK